MTTRTNSELSTSERESTRHGAYVARGLGAGAITWAATMGMLLGIGRREGTLWRPLNAASHLVVGSRGEGVWGFDAFVTPVGGLVVLVVSAAAGVAVARVASSRRTIPDVAAAVAVALLGYLVHVHLVARSPGGLAAHLSLGEMRALYLAAAIALGAGMRNATPRNRGASVH